ncbi:MULTISPECIES: head-tail connector protein [Arsenophonus]|uniref:Head-tail connector protein n=1 Tax=Arsenophonus nasoniae TaxID=638 RepID=A0AA95GMU6_9GAMM|nr:head-tail connector protein [Arsenophonus nasoniae]WGM01782.1 head-tail connector protein [Arsenophonus nasoniae]
MIEVVTLEEVKSHLRIDHDVLDTDLQNKINSSTAAVLDFVEYWLQKNGNDEKKIKELPDFNRIKSAVLILIGILYRDPDGADKGLYPRGELPFPVTSLINSLHKPVII